MKTSRPMPAFVGQRASSRSAEAPASGLPTVILLFALPAALLFTVPGAADSLLYDRAAILQGEWWRLWTGHWVHFLPSHLFWNLAVLLGAGLWLERLHPGWLLRYTLIAAPLISLALLLGESAMHSYGGLSGLAAGVVTGLALTQIRRRRADRLWWGGLLVLVAAKLFVDARHGPLFSDFSSTPIRSSALAHAAGAGIALAFFLSPQARFCPPLFGASSSAQLSPPFR